MSSEIDEGYWIAPGDHAPDELIAVEVERAERTPDGKYVTGRILRELLLYSGGRWYTVGLKRQINQPARDFRRWRALV